MALLESSGGLRPAPRSLRVAGVRHSTFVLEKLGLPIFNRKGKLHEGAISGTSGHLELPPLLLEEVRLSRDEGIERAIELAQVTRLWAEPRSDRGWFATEAATVPAWQVILPADQPFGTWQVTLDARTGEALALVDLVRSGAGSGLVHDPNPALSPVPTLETLFDLDASGFLSGRITKVIDQRSVEAFRPDHVFVFPTQDPRFVQTGVYWGLTNAGRFAEAHGFPIFAEPLLGFTNLPDPLTGGEFNNAFYDPFFMFFGFGNGDGVLTANLGKDADIAAHEMAHHVFQTLVDPLVSATEDPVIAMSEGVADTFAALLTGDPDVGESTIPGQPFLRTIDNSLIFPDDAGADPHETGLIFAGLNWDLIQALGPDAFADLLMAGLPFLAPDAFFDEYPAALRTGDQLVHAGANAGLIASLAEARGLKDPFGPEFQAFLEDGVPQFRSTTNGELHSWVFPEIPGSTALSITTTGTGDIDLLVAPISTFDPNDANTFMLSDTFASNEEVSINQFTLPSIDDDDSWLIAVLDFDLDGTSSSYTLTATATLPEPALSLPGSITQSLDSPGELDLFIFNGNAGQVVRVEGTALTPGFDPLVGIFAPKTVEILAADDDSGPGFDSLIQGVILPETKKYAVVVGSPIGDIDASSGTGSYRISLSLCVNIGVDSDGDGLVNDCDDDDDGDQVLDSLDESPIDPLACSDLDLDLCDDCASGAFDPFDEGLDTDGDVLCDLGDPDDDNDGCLDPEDPQPLIPSVDEDLDFIGADCDPCPLDPENDADADNHCANADNCPSDPNPDQEDVDEDGIGDLCDSCPLDSTNADLDGDGECAATDNCRYTANADQSDSGGFDSPLPNGKGDSCECGDTSDDGEVNALDMALLWRHIFGRSPGVASLEKCRMGPSGDCDEFDLDVLRSALAGILTEVGDLCAAAAPQVSLDLDGSTEWLANPAQTTLGIADSWTFSTWIRDRSFASSTANYFQLLRPDSDSRIDIFQAGNGSTNPLIVHLYSTSGTIFKAGLWNNVMSPGSTFHHIVVVWDGAAGALGSLSVYVDGELRPPSIVGTDLAGVMHDSERSVLLGGSPSLDGLIGHTALWARALSAQEIAQVHFLGHAINLRGDIGDYQSSAHLRHYWRLGEDPVAIGRDFAANPTIDLGASAVNLSFDDAVLLGP